MSQNVIYDGNATAAFEVSVTVDLQSRFRLV